MGKKLRMRTLKFNLFLTLMSFTLVAQDSLASKTKELAAIHTQEQSIQKLKQFLKTHAGDSREPDFLIRLADLYFEKSGISFQYTEGESVKTSSKFYKDSLNQATSVLSEVIRKYPSHVTITDAHFKRGKAFKELKKIDLAKNDFLKILTLSPDYIRLDSALMDLADFEQDENHHEQALKYLLQIEKNEGSQFYTLALHKAAWSYFNLTNFSMAIKYLKKEIITYQTKKSELPYLESAYQDLALFYFEALNKKAGFANVEDGVSLFQELSHDQFDTQKRPFFGSLVTRFSKLLKAYQLSSDLDELKKIMIQQYPQMPETMEIAMLIYEYHFDRHEYGKLKNLLSEADQIRTKLNQPALNTKFEQVLSQSLTQLHQLVMKNKQSTDLDQLLKPLMELTDFSRNHLGDKNATAVLATYSMAETSFAINRFAMATKYYSELLKPEVILPTQLSKSNILVRLVSSRFQELKKMDLIHEKLAITKMDAPLKNIKNEEKSNINEWLNWVFDPQSVKNIDTFSFQLEAFKLKYEYINRAEAMTGLENFSIQNISTEEGKVAAAIVLDTLNQSQDWNKIYNLSQKILKNKGFNDPKFQEKLQDLSSDSHLKITLASKNPELILSRTKDCIHQFKNTRILLQCKLIQAKTWVSLKQYSESEKALIELSKTNLKDDDLKTVTLMKAEVHQKQGKLNQAAQELEHYLELTQFKDVEMSQQVLQIYWFQRNFKKINPLISNTKFCNSLKNNICEQYQAAMAVSSPFKPSGYQKIFKLTTKGSKNSISLWAIAALEQSAKLPFQDRLVLLQRLSNQWENTDPFLQIQFLDIMKSRVNNTVVSIRKNSSSIAPLTSGNEANIEKRIRLLQDVDITFAKVMKLNWIEIKLNTVNELNLIYQQLAHDLKSIGTPDNLIQPFVKKQSQLVDASQQLMAMSFHPKSSSISLLDNEIKEKIPSVYWEEWSDAVKQQKPDYLYYLVSLRQQDEFSPLLRGLILTSILKDSASTEGFEMIKSAPQTAWKDSIALRVAQ